MPGLIQKTPIQKTPIQKTPIQEKPAKKPAKNPTETLSEKLTKFSTNRNRMSLTAKIYVSAVVVIGAAVAVSELARWESQDLIRFFCYLTLAIVASRLKVSLPGISGALSVLFIFILFAIVELSLPEALFLGCSAILTQC